jgi:co-chaperonin GroES (HSP10)
MFKDKEIILIGDKVLVDPSKESQKSAGGLYLPPGVKQKEKVQGGYIVQTGPGYVSASFEEEDYEPWESVDVPEPEYIPLQAKEGDYALFIKKAGIEVEIDNKTYIIIPHSAILALMRDKY